MDILFQSAVAFIFSMLLLFLLLLIWPRRAGLRRMLGGGAGGSNISAYGAAPDSHGGHEGGSGGEC